LANYDVIVVGAGTAGCMAAKTLASAGLNVCLVDRKQKQSIGEKVCGDAIGRHHFDNLDLTYPRGEELEQLTSGIDIYSPDQQTVFRVHEERLSGFMVNRHLFGQRLLKEASDAGAVLLDSTHVLEAVLRKGSIRGVSAKNVKTGSKIELSSEVTIDASGVSAVLRSKVSPQIGIEQEVSKEDYVVCYREIRELEEEISKPDICRIYLNLESAPGGYYWFFPEGGTKVNVGLGVAATGGFPNPKDQLHRIILENPPFKSSTILHGGGGIVPTRRPLDSLVGNGIVVIGDAACQVNPIHGGGIGPSMTGGKIAGEVIVEALEEGNPSRDRLWPTNVRYVRSYGAKQASLDVFRIFLQCLSNEELNYGMRYRLITEEDVLEASLGGDVKLTVTDATRRVFEGLGRPQFLKRLYTMARTSKKIKRLYREYPDSPEGLPEWKVKVKELLGRIRNI